jgi:glyoxylase-like metal-dependent hydrolase (beta-lactamase superfamily II)
MEVIRDLHWIKGAYSNIYLWIGDDGLMLVDSGQPGDRKRITKYLRRIGFNLSDITAILITHADYDHAGTAAVIQEQSGATIYTGKKSADLLVNGKSPEHLPGPVQFALDKWFRYRALPDNVIQVLDDGETITEGNPWQLIATPGHSPDHQSFISAVDSVLFAGDALSTRRNRLKCSPRFNTGDMAAARQSAKRLLRITPAIIACGHGPPMVGHSADQLLQLDRELSD